MSAQYKFMCGYEWFTSAKTIHSPLISYRDCYLSKINDLSQNLKNRSYGEKSNRLFETYKKSVVTNGRHIYATSADMAMHTICAYPPSQNVLPHWKYVLYCCFKFPRIYLSDQEPDRHNYNESPSIRFHIYHLISRCTVHGRRPLNEKKMVVCVFKIRLLWHLINYTS